MIDNEFNYTNTYESGTQSDWRCTIKQINKFDGVECKINHEEESGIIKFTIEKLLTGDTSNISEKLKTVEFTMELDGELSKTYRRVSQ